METEVKLEKNCSHCLCRVITKEKQCKPDVKKQKSDCWLQFSHRTLIFSFILNVFTSRFVTEPQHCICCQAQKVYSCINTTNSEMRSSKNHFKRIVSQIIKFLLLWKLFAPQESLEIDTQIPSHFLPSYELSFHFTKEC